MLNCLGLRRTEVGNTIDRSQTDMVAAVQQQVSEDVHRHVKLVVYSGVEDSGVQHTAGTVRNALLNWVFNMEAIEYATPT